MSEAVEIKYSRCRKKVKINNHIIFVKAFKLLLKDERLLAIKAQKKNGNLG